MTAEALFQALAKYAGKIAATEDPKKHREAGKQLQGDLRRLREGKRG